MKDLVTTPLSEEVGRDKHRQPGESFEDAMRRIATALADDEDHEAAFLDILLNRRFLPAGRVQSAAGSFRTVTAFNCFVSGEIPDSMSGIMDRLKEAAVTMQKGGGIGYDFSTLRPRGDLIHSLQSQSSGPVSFMEPFDATCGTIASAGNRRGAQMGVLRIDHPDIRRFIHAKQNDNHLTRFNISVGITDEFMIAVRDDQSFDLRFNGQVYETLRARDLWDELMTATWDWAEPGVLFLDHINDMNNLYYCETIAATNPCGEQPLPPHGACLLGSTNWTAYVDFTGRNGLPAVWNQELFLRDIPVIVRAMDNVIDRTIYPLPEQEAEARNKRRMGLGPTGVANALEAMGVRYGSDEALFMIDAIMKTFTNEVYRASTRLAKEKGAFPLYDRDKYLASQFVQRLDADVIELIKANGVRNALLTSAAPAGSISVAAGNLSSGIEPPFSLVQERTIKEFDGHRVEMLFDYAYRTWGIEGVTAKELTPKQHVDVLTTFQKWTDSACSKTCNIGDEVTFEEFKDVYMLAWQGGAKGCTTFRAAGRRYGILNEVKIEEGAACFIDPATGKKTCDA